MSHPTDRIIDRYARIIAAMYEELADAMVVINGEWGDARMTVEDCHKDVCQRVDVDPAEMTRILAEGRS